VNERVTQANLCEVEVTLEVVGGRWKGVILYHLLKGPQRFGQLRRLIPGVTQRMLTLQLRELEQAGLIVRTVHDRVPPHVEYHLSDLGLSLRELVLSMRDWGRTYRAYLDTRQTAAPPEPSQDRPA